LNRDPAIESEIRDKVDELIQKASDEFLAVEVAPDTTVDEEVKSQDL
jgi:hypothetical protein